MNESSSVSAARGHPWGWVALSVVLFGALMAFRAELRSPWLQDLVAGVAFAFLYPAMRGFRRKT
jgi:cytochrome c biogenesis protein ResB